MEPKEKDYLEAAAKAVEQQAMDDPSLGIPVDPDVAEHMGIFVENALSEQDLLDIHEILVELVDRDLPDPDTVQD